MTDAIKSLAKDVLDYMEKADIKRENARLASIFHVNTTMMRSTLEYLIGEGKVIGTRAGTRSMHYYAAKFQVALPDVSVSTFRPCTHKISILGSREGSNEYLNWPSKHT